MTKSVLGFVVEHTDNCPRCSACDFCPTGRALMKAAAELCGKMLAGVPVEVKAKA